MTRKTIIKKFTKSGAPGLSFRALSCVLISVVFCLFLSSCKGTVNSYVRTSFALDTAVQVTVYDQKDIKAAEDALLFCKQMEKVFSRTDPEAALYRLNESFREGAGSAAQVSDDLFTMIESCVRFYALSDGAFDVTLGALSSIYDFSGEIHRVPSEEERTGLLLHTGADKLRLTENHGVSSADPETVLDLGAAAKGYIADRMKEKLISEGVEHAIINLGGNVLVIGEKSVDGGLFSGLTGRKSTAPYEAGISKPVYGGSSEVLLTVPLSDESLVTSGTYQRYFEQDGTIFHHILDPKTGLPVSNGLLSVSVRTKNSFDADILSTACFVLGIEGSQKLIDQLDFDAEVIFIDEEMKVTRIRN